MSALLCCGPVFDPQGLAAESYLYQWLQNMLHSNERKVDPMPYMGALKYLTFDWLDSKARSQDSPVIVIQQPFSSSVVTMGHQSMLLL